MQKGEQRRAMHGHVAAARFQVAPQRVDHGRRRVLGR
jgi:hypothetical protein